jgi:hypothetical protein
MKQPPEIREQELGLVEDGDAMFESVLWYEEQRVAKKLQSYEKKYIAILDKQIIDADADKQALYHRLDALGNSINQRRVVVRYVASIEDLRLYG